MDLNGLIGIGAYGMLVVLWAAILVVYLLYLRSGKKLGRPLVMMLTILAVDAFRTLYESFHFGLSYSSTRGFLPPSVGEFLGQGGMLLVPKGLNIFAASLILFLLLRDWLPKEIEEKAEADEALADNMGKFQAVYENSPLGVLIADSDGQVEACNPALLRLTGYDEQSLKKVGWRAFTHPQGHQKEAKAVGDLREGKRTQYRLEKFFEHKDGRTLWLGLTLSSVPDGKGGCRHLVALVEDITERRVSEVELRLLKEALEQSPVTVIITDPEATIQYANPAFTRVTGYELEEALGENPRILKSGYQDQAFYEKMWAELTAGRAWKGEFCNKKKDGTLYWEKAVIFPVQDGKGKTTNYMAVKEDVTESRRVSQALLESEQRLQDFAETASDWLWETDADLRFTYLSERFREVRGLDPDSIIGKTRDDLAGAEDGGPWKGHLADLQARRPFRDFEFPAPEADGSWYRISGKPVFDENGRFTGYRGVGVDVTMERYDKAELDRNRQLLTGVLNSSLDGFMVLTAVHAKSGKIGDFTISQINPRAEKLLRREKQELLGGLITQVMPGTVTTGLFALAVNTVETGEPFDLEHFYGHDNISSWFHLVGVKLGDGIVVTFSDINDRKEAEIQVATLLDSLKRSNADLQQFAYVASHDLQEPLRMIRSYLQLLERRYKGKLDKDADEFIGYAVDGAARMQHLIQDLLTFSRVDSRGKEPQPVDAHATVDAALSNLRVSMEEAGAEVVVGALPTVMGDDTQLISLFQNLIGNAIKYRAHGRTPRIEVGAQREGSQWRFSIQDNGIGINEKDFTRIFEIFQRLHNRDQYSGTGIGLAVCKKIVERHGGRIWVEAHEGEGSTFLFTLPAEEKGS